MIFALYPLRYLRLRDEDGRLLLWRDLLLVLFLAGAVSLPFLFVAGANFFSAAGFVDRLGSLSATLTGFYVAALVAVATFASSLGNLDKPMEVGGVLLRIGGADGDLKLTRREYVCSMFGYLAFISLVLSVFAILSVVLSAPLSRLSTMMVKKHGGLFGTISNALSDALIVLYSIAAAHLVITTCYGLYYLVDRLYSKAPELLPKKDLAE